MKIIRRAYKKTVSIVNETAVQIYENFVGDRQGFLLESFDKNNGRFVFLGKDPEEYITSKDSNLIIQRKNGDMVTFGGNPVDSLKSYYSDFEIRKDEGDMAFTGGLIGAFGYDFVRYKENLPDANQDEMDIETIQLMLVTEFISIDHLAETCSFVVLEEDNEAGRKRAMGRCNEMEQEAFIVSSKNTDNFVHDGIIMQKSETLASYTDKVEKIKEYIREGHVFQTVLSQRWRIETNHSGFNLYKQLRVKNPSPYLYYMNFKGFEIIGSSPEMIVKQVDNRVFTCPIAGTRERGSDEAQDLRLQEELINDPKETAEHVMLVDLARNDMGRIADFGTVKVTQFMDVQKYSQVMHIVSLVEGKKKRQYHPVDLLNAFLPAGTLSGAPKIRAMEIIDELEEARRGLYGGAIGYIDFNGNMDFCITIRTMIKKGKDVYLQAGAGIVADSNPESEYMECCNKVRALAKILVGEETL